MVPRIETERLILRGHKLSDESPSSAMFRDENVVRHLGGTPLAREDSWRKIMSAHGAWDLLGFGYWAIERKADGAYLGLAGFADFKRDLSPSIEGTPEMGWILASEAHGKGLAGEAVAAGLEWADAQLAGQEITAIIDPKNGASIRLAERSGFAITDETSYRGEPILILRRPPR